MRRPARPRRAPAPWRRARRRGRRPRGPGRSAAVPAAGRGPRRPRGGPPPRPAPRARPRAPRSPRGLRHPFRSGPQQGGVLRVQRLAVAVVPAGNPGQQGGGDLVVDGADRLRPVLGGRLAVPPGAEEHDGFPGAGQVAVEVDHVEEPYLRVSVLTPAEYTGTVMELCQERRGDMDTLTYLSPERLELVYHVPLAEVVVDFFDQLKSRTKGYASLDYEPVGYRPSNLVKVDILLNGVPVDAFSTVVHRDKAHAYGRRMAEKLRQLIPRQLFDVPIQASVGGRIIARETVKAKRKDVLAKCYGGDITRKRKLLERQKEGKRKMKSIGRVDVPQEAFVSALRLEE
ncbi:MAG: hypothetical protein KY452_03500 [Actinobacteria bacterium]|nr:hypothetical protein [Actinomycetota bacterium]